MVDCVGDDGAHDLVDTDLDGGCVLGERNAKASVAGTTVFLVGEVVKTAVLLVLQGRLTALFVVELEVQALRCAEIFFSVIHDHDFLKCLLIDNTTPTPFVVESTGVMR